MPDSTVTPLRDLEIIKAREEQHVDEKKHASVSHELSERIDQLNELRAKTARTAADIGGFLKQQKELLIEQKQIRFNLKVMGKGITKEEETRFNKIINAYEKKVRVLQQQLRAVEFINDCIIVGMRAENLKTKVNATDPEVRAHAEKSLKRLQPIVRVYNKKIASSLYLLNPSRFSNLQKAAENNDDVSVVQKTMGGLVDSYSRNLAADKAALSKQKSKELLQQKLERQKLQDIYKQKADTPTAPKEEENIVVRTASEVQAALPSVSEKADSEHRTQSSRPKTLAHPDVAGRQTPLRGKPQLRQETKSQEPTKPAKVVTTQPMYRQAPPSPSPSRTQSRNAASNLFSDSGMGVSAERDMQAIYDRVFDEMLEEYESERKKKHAKNPPQGSRNMGKASGDESF